MAASILKNLLKVAASTAAVAGAVASLGFATSASATVYNLTNVRLSDGTTVSGSFTTTPSGYVSSDPSGFNVTTLTGALSGYNYTPSINPSYTPGGTSITFNRAAYFGFLTLTFLNPLTGSGSDPIIGGIGGPSYECDTWSCPSPSSDVRYVITSRDFPAPAIVAVPEPATWAMMLLGFGGLGAAMRSRRNRAVATA
jgi:hypothetical protein